MEVQRDGGTEKRRDGGAEGRSRELTLKIIKNFTQRKFRNFCFKQIVLVEKNKKIGARKSLGTGNFLEKFQGLA
jgi:hypothetical protein